ncbi:hypothetical protein PISMIDRAFT_109910 [Pisolithus microcarpus 441]|uniref:Unplaced genomic scaffold scaffold_126, whole genome shotgun sequence n=1 Tax=Pisolithus microcarpus 441 TaxID=765257 RepID=A0A0C9YNB6_9AGAM|nr:hypothetical protein PISMIDRAFT_109910 [Pisolithus microcarpus 441]
MTTTPSSMASMSPLPVSCLINAHNCLMGSRCYLGDTSISANFEWVCEGQGHVLVCVPAMQNDDPPTATGHDTSVDDNNVDSPGIPPTPLTPPTFLSAIVHIDQEDFWLTPDGRYQGPNGIWKEFLDVKPSCTLVNPGMEPVMSDFPVTLHMLQLFTQHCVTPSFSSGKSFFSSDEHGPSHFKLCHRLFKVGLHTVSIQKHYSWWLVLVQRIESDLDGKLTSQTSTSAAATDPFSFELWPLTKERTHAELLALKASHHILPLPMYDLAGNLIQPSAYCCSLQGAIMEVHFTLLHWGIASAKWDVYGGVIQLIHILVPPAPTLVTTRKRKLALHIKDDDSPSRKTMKV